jgi:hypothetical protein
MIGPKPASTSRDVDLDRADLGERRYLQPMTACP